MKIGPGLKNCLLVPGSVLFLFCILEITFRILGIRGFHPPRQDKYSTYRPSPPLEQVRHLFKPYSTVSYRYNSNPRGYFDENNSLEFTLNNYGFRGPDFSLNKESGKKRVIVLGDSFTLGEGVLGKDTFVEKLGQKLGGKFEVLNMGVSGWNTVDEISYFLNAGIYLNPDIVIVVYVLNDAFPGVLDVYRDFQASYEKEQLRFSYLLSFIYSRIAKKIVTRNYIKEMLEGVENESEEWRVSLDYLRKGRNLAERFNAKFAVVLFPFMYDFSPKNPFRKLHTYLKDFCLSMNIPFYDMFNDFLGKKDIDLWVHPTDQHPNEKAHDIASDALYRFLKSEKMVD